jgi:Tfp pilus assembly protein PilZ
MKDDTETESSIFISLKGSSKQSAMFMQTSQTFAIGNSVFAFMTSF